MSKGVTRQIDDCTHIAIPPVQAADDCAHGITCCALRSAVMLNSTAMLSDEEIVERLYPRPIQSRCNKKYGHYFSRFGADSRITCPSSACIGETSGRRPLSDFSNGTASRQTWLEPCRMIVSTASCMTL